MPVRRRVGILAIFMTAFVYVDNWNVDRTSVLTSFSGIVASIVGIYYRAQVFKDIDRIWAGYVTILWV